MVRLVGGSAAAVIGGAIIIYEVFRWATRLPPGGPNYLGTSNVIGGVTSFGLNGTCGGTGGTALGPTRAADGWMVFGTRGMIQGRVPLSAPWSALHATLGTVQANARGVLAVRFCSFPKAIFTLSADPGAVVTSGGQVDLSSIPPDATIHHLFIMNRSLASHLLGC